MALFTDELVTQVSDLLAYESNLGEVSAAEGIDLDVKIHLARTEVGRSSMRPHDDRAMFFFQAEAGQLSALVEQHRGGLN